MEHKMPTQYLVNINPDGSVIVTWRSIVDKGERDAAILRKDSVPGQVIEILLEGIVGGAR
jgi:hypothetical protein